MCVVNDSGTEGGCPKCNPILAGVMRMNAAELASWNHEFTRRSYLAHKTGVAPEYPELPVRLLAAQPAPAPPDMMASFRVACDKKTVPPAPSLGAVEKAPVDSAIAGWLNGEKPKESFGSGAATKEVSVPDRGRYNN